MTAAAISPEKLIVPVSGAVSMVMLTRKLFALIDSADAPAVSKYVWHARGTADAPYAATRLPGVEKMALMHRLLLDAPDCMSVDHVNGCTLDNRRSNLRLCSVSENRANAPKPAARRGRVAASTPYKGVYLNQSGNPYAQIRHQGKHHYLGVFRSLEEAARAYDTAAKQFFGPFAFLNFPEQSAPSVQVLSCTRSETQCRPAETENRLRETAA